jgi:serine/threonine protein kinase
MARFLNSLFGWRRKDYGGYELLREVGRGGMSRIWMARHPETGRTCAVKVLTAESAEMMEYFRKAFEAEEGAIALRLDHPNVVRTFGYGRGKRNEYYIVMEYVDGPNLATLIALQEPRVRQNRFGIVMQMASGLRYIHERGLIHRDFCPKNVLYGSDEVAKITDFGLTVPAGVRSRLLTARAGTASYMAPEQIRGLQLDERTDIYGFGVSVFEVLTSRRPFPASADRSRRMQDHLNVEPLRLRQVEPGLSEEMDAVVSKCIEKDLKLRYKSMDEVMRDLQAAAEIALSGREGVERPWKEPS